MGRATILKIMALLPNPAILTESGDFDITNIGAGKEYLLLLKGVFDGASIALKYMDPVTDEWAQVLDADAITDVFEDRLIAPSSRLRFSVTSAGASAAISVNLIPIHQ